MVCPKIRCRRLRINAIRNLRFEIDALCLSDKVTLTEQNRTVDGYDTIPSLWSSPESLGGLLSRPKMRTPTQQTTSRTMTTTLLVCLSMSVRPWNWMNTNVFPITMLNWSMAQNIPELRDMVVSSEFSVRKLPCAVQMMAAPTPSTADRA